MTGWTLAEPPEQFGDQARVLRWMREWGDGLWMTPEAGRLLSARLRVRSYSARTLSGLLGAVVLTLIAFVAVDIATDADLPIIVSCWAGVSVLVAAVAVAGFVVVRTDRRIAAALPNRVSRGERTGFAHVMGRVNLVFVRLVIAVELAFVVLLPLEHAGRGDWGYPLALGAFWSAMALAGRAVLHRRAIATDSASLAVDERLRYRDLVVCVSLLPFGLALARFFVPTTSWIVLVASVGWFAGNFWMLVARKAVPWRRRPKSTVVTA